MNDSSTSVICTVRNDAEMLRFWLRHHRRIFDYGAVIDYSSTDDTMTVFQQEAPPHWTFSTSRNRNWDFWLCDEEIMSIETTLGGWKMALNCTEFLMHHNLSEYLGELGPRTSGVATTGVVMVDSRRERELGLDERELFLQRRHGYFEDDVVPVTETNARMRSRLIHNQPNGAYELGRHRYGVPAKRDPTLFLLWFGYSPWIIQRRRKTQFASQMSSRNISENAGLQHIRSSADIWSDYLVELARSYNVYERSVALRNVEQEMLRGFDN